MKVFVIKLYDFLISFQFLDCMNFFFLVRCNSAVILSFDTQYVRYSESSILANINAQKFMKKVTVNVYFIN